MHICETEIHPANRKISKEAGANLKEAFQKPDFMTVDEIYEISFPIHKLVISGNCYLCRQAEQLNMHLSALKSDVSLHM